MNEPVSQAMPGDPPQGAAATPPTHGRRWLRGLALVLLVFAAYGPVLRGGFVWDDTVLIDRNSLVQGETTLRTIWFAEDFPLTLVAFWLQWLAWGKNPVGYHAVNVLLHALNVILVWRVLVRLQTRGAWLAAALFAVHPVCVASVGWISELKNTLSLPFFLASLWCWLKFEEGNARSALANSKSGTRHRIYYWLALGAFLLALLSKTSTVMLPVVLLACTWWRHKRLPWRDGLRAAPFFALALGFGLLTVWFQTQQTVAGETVQTEDLWGRLAGAGWALWFNLGKALWPVHLSIVYPHWEIQANSVMAWLPLGLWAGGLSVCWWFRQGWGRAALLALGCFTVLLFPALGFFDMYFLVFSRVSDHFAYLPIIAVLALVAAVAVSVTAPVKEQATSRATPLRHLTMAATTGVILVLAGLTIQRARVFATDEGLWRDTLVKNPAAWNAHNNLGCILAERQQLDAAMKAFTASLELNPRNAQAHVNLGRALAMKGQFKEAETHFQAALRLKPGDLETFKAYGNALAGQGRLDEAVHYLRAAVRKRPDPETRLQLAGLLRATGNPREAITQFRAVLAAQPNTPEALSNLAWLLATSAETTLRNGPEAVELAESACRLTGRKEAQMVGTLAAAYAEAGRFADAVTTAQQAVDLANATGNPQFAAINQQLLRMYRAGRPYHEPPPKETR